MTYSLEGSPPIGNLSQHAVANRTWARPHQRRRHTSLRHVGRFCNKTFSAGALHTVRRATQAAILPACIVFLLLCPRSAGAIRPRKPADHRPSFGTIPTCENPGVAQSGIEPGSPWWEASGLTAQLLQSLFRLNSSRVPVLLPKEISSLFKLAWLVATENKSLGNKCETSWFTSSSAYNPLLLLGKWSSAGMQGRAKRDNPRENSLTSGTFPTCENPGATSAGNRIRFALIEVECSTRCITVAPINLLGAIHAVANRTRPASNCPSYSLDPSVEVTRQPELHADLVLLILQFFKNTRDRNKTFYFVVGDCVVTQLGLVLNLVIFSSDLMISAVSLVTKFHICDKTKNSVFYTYPVVDLFHGTGATVAERLDCSPPTKANRVQSPAGLLRIFAFGNRAGRCRWLEGFLGNLPFPPPFHSGAAPY
ncbi:hypothetical protein PR048_025986 [Dryococelus australis]|uniref:Uncharacterized protein n=1 Tax=Dryococelus australis TaxID=614101 RepID=A0ABQ9GK48_9NEOP|nr:hypothetical protein PR048_025986 [Dryococelus australis]